MWYINSFFSFVISVFASFRFVDLLDVLIITFLIYEIIKISRETQAAQLIKGIVLLFIATFLSNLLNLKTLNMILTNVFFWGPLAIIVLFQPELRRILEHVGRTNMRNKVRIFSSSHEDTINSVREKAIYIIANACESLSKTKTGALIVFERQTKLGDILETGVEINADISEEIIGNIFFKNSPLHDGAVIIRDSKIIAASCFLPKPTKEETISNRLGSRHRAAIGMSENSDAVILVVSEETGDISIAESGKLTKRLNRTELITRLKEEMFLQKPFEVEKKLFFWRKNR